MASPYVPDVSIMVISVVYFCIANVYNINCSSPVSNNYFVNPCRDGSSIGTTVPLPDTGKGGVESRGGAVDGMYGLFHLLPLLYYTL